MSPLNPGASPFFEGNVEAHRRKWGLVPRVLPIESFSEGRWQELHGESPIETASGWLDRASTGRPIPETVCVIGAGLGFVVDAITERSTSRVLVLEPEPALVPWLLARRDWRPLIESGRLLVLAGPDFDGSQNAWRLFGDGSADPLTLPHPVLGRLRPDVTRLAGQVIGRARQGARGNEDARRKLATPYLVNTLRNASLIARSPSVDTLFGQHKGRPIVLAAAGPSLNRNLEELRPFRDQVVLIAVDTALKPLLSAGLPPDFVVALDPSDANARHLTDVVVPETTSLVAEGSIGSSSFVAFGDRVFVFRVADHAPWPWLRKMGIERGTLRAWGSVVTSAFDLALRMGGDPIVCIGTDLAYTGRQLYARGTTYEEDWRITAGPDRPIEWVWETVIAQRAVPARDIGGGEVQSTKGLLVFRDWLVAESRRPGMPRLVNATGGGILFGGGFEQRSLADLALQERPAPRLGTRDSGSGTRGSGAESRVPSPESRIPSDDLDLHFMKVLMSSNETPPLAESHHVMPYRTRSRKKRIEATMTLRSKRRSDVERWTESANLDPAWERRAQVAGRLVPSGSRVLDLGAGLEALARHIPADCRYTPADLMPRSERTVVADVNRGEFPAGEFDVVATLGLFEYVHNVRALLTAIHTRAPLLIASYCVRKVDDPEPRLERGFVNEFSLNEFVDLCQSAGWTVGVAECTDVTPLFDQWVFALRR